MSTKQTGKEKPGKGTVIGRVDAITDTVKAPPRPVKDNKPGKGKDDGGKS